jgi:nucleoside-triphosphatase THEP1
MSPAKNLLLTGNPGVGKTTLMVSLVKALADYHPAGFVTWEIREGGTRKGFLLVKGHYDIKIVRYSHCVL